MYVFTKFRIMKFQDYKISEKIKQNISELGYTRPTDIQFKSIPYILKGEDVLAIAQTGTGKTAAFAIPVVDIIHRQKKSKRTDYIRCVVMVPTHELAIQITDVFNLICKHTNVKAISIYGGVGQDSQITNISKGADIIIATPGRMFDLISQGFLKLNKIKILILDEADHMLDLGFIKDIEDLIKFLPEKRQTLFFSATINKKIKRLAYSLVRNPIRIQISPRNPVSKNINHSVVFIEMDDKRFFLEKIIKENPEKKMLVFVRTKVRAERVCNAMKRAGIESITMHGDKNHHNRIDILNRFKTGKSRTLIATDITARGIDIANVDFVVNYDLPEKAENYVHRVGRTGRGNKKGIAISFCSKHEKNILSEIENFTGYMIDRIHVSKQEYKDITKLSDKKNDLETLMEEIEMLEKKQNRKKQKS